MKNNDEVKLILTADTTKDSRRYNLPTSSEVSVLIPGPILKNQQTGTLFYSVNQKTTLMTIRLFT